MEPGVILHILKGTAILGGLDEPHLRDIVPLARTVRHPAGSYVFQQGDPPDALYVVSTGHLRVSTRVPGADDFTFTNLGPGSVFGEVALLDGRPRSASVLTTSDCVLLRIGRGPFLDLLGSRPEIATGLIRVLAGQIRQLSRRVEEGASLPARERLVRHLLRLPRVPAAPGEVGVAIAEHLPQSVLASALGLSRQTVNRLLGALQSEGLLEVDRARIVLLDLRALHAE